MINKFLEFYCDSYGLIEEGLPCDQDGYDEEGFD
jgi:hypothetical protein